MMMQPEPNYLRTYYILPKTYKASQQGRTYVLAAMALIFILLISLMVSVSSKGGSIFILALGPIIIGAAGIFIYKIPPYGGITLERDRVIILGKEQNIEIPAQNIQGYDLSYISTGKGGLYSISLVYVSANESFPIKTQFGLSTDWYQDTKFLGWIRSMNNFGSSKIEGAILDAKITRKSRPILLVFIILFVAYMMRMLFNK
ncbi:hypothetical protein [Solilutibacter silvestris]|uniref:hypothetical protein n=1 Tax=Solilutibacter silvestris TaxID=1645665 RepID=UPI00101AD423|nr:hypothetical protein [Lysobacter silvestris]